MKKHRPNRRVFALLLLFAIAAGCLLPLASCKRKEEAAFHYLSDDLSPYISLPRERYLGHEIALTEPEIDEMEIDNRILAAQAAHKDETPLAGGAYLLERTTAPGDVVYIYYRGYRLDGDGREIDLYASTSNFGSSDGASAINQTPDEVEIGSGKLIPGLELGMVGKNPKDYAKFSPKERGTVEEGDVLYATYNYVTTEDGGQLYQNITERIDLAREDLDEVYGEGFRDALIGRSIGVTFSFDENLRLGKDERRYTSFKVNFVTRDASGLAPLVVEGRFPTDYQDESLAGLKVFFEIYIQKTVAYSAPAVDETFIRETLGLTEEDLSAYEGDTVEKYRAYLRAELEEERTDRIVIAAQEKMWAYLKDVAEIKGYPQKEVDRIYHQNRNSILSTFQQNYTTTYASVDEFARAYYGLEEGTDWEAYLLTQVKDEIKERLIEYTLMRAENLIPTDAEVKEHFDSILSDLTDYYCGLWGISREKYETEEEYERARAGAKQEILDYYTEEYFTEGAYYEYIAFHMLRLFSIKVNGEAFKVPEEK